MLRAARHRAGRCGPGRRRCAGPGPSAPRASRPRPVPTGDNNDGGPGWRTASRPAVDQPARWPLAVGGAMPPVSASSRAVSARPSISAVSMLARAGSPIRAATEAMTRSVSHSSVLTEACTSHNRARTAPARRTVHDHLLHPLRDRAPRSGGLRPLCPGLGPGDPALRRRPDRLFRAARRLGDHRLWRLFDRQPRRLRSLSGAAARRSARPGEFRLRPDGALHPLGGPALSQARVGAARAAGAAR